jgi:phenylalanyl-tRNA synthetase beta chain
MSPKANDRACQLIAKLAGGVVHKGIVDTHPKKFKPVEINFRPERANHVLGSNIKTESMLHIFDGLDITYNNDKKITVYQPSFRPDLTREIDLIEEIARIWGLDNIDNAYRPGGALEAKISPEHAFKDQLRQLLIGHGFYETFSLTLTDKRQLEKIDPDRPMLPLMNPLSEEMSVLRPDLIISVMKTLRHNINHGNKDIKIFEIGAAYKPTLNELPDEPQYLCIGLSGREQPVSWHQAEKFTDFYSLKAELEAIFGFFDINNVDLKPQLNPYFDDEYSFVITISGSSEPLVICGKIKKDVGKIINLKQDCFVAQIDLELLTKMGLTPRSFKPLPRYPATDRDIALVVDNNIPAKELIETIYKAAGKLAVEVFPFDLYKGKNIGEGKKSIAIRIVYRSEERTLTDDETDKIHNKVVKSITERFKAELRT